MASEDLKWTFFHIFLVLRRGSHHRNFYSGERKLQQIYFFPRNEYGHHLLNLKLLQTCMSFFLLFNTKEHILKNAGTKNLMIAIDFNSVEEILSQWLLSTVWLPTFFKFLCKKK